MKSLIYTALFVALINSVVGIIYSNSLNHLNNRLETVERIVPVPMEGDHIWVCKVNAENSEMKCVKEAK